MHYGQCRGIKPAVSEKNILPFEFFSNFEGLKSNIIM
jgi:hypothetical protein